MTYVLSDIHGNEKRFRSVMKQIRLQPEDTLYVLGDVVDRYPDGIRILREIMKMPNANMLLGNHEYMMLRALGKPYDNYLDDGKAMDHWYRNGGQVTHRHWKWLRKTTRQEIVEYLWGLPLNIHIQVGGRDFTLVHGAPVETYFADPKYPNANHYAVWKRLEAAQSWPREDTLVFGHTPTRYYREKNPMEIWMEDRRIGIDCGCGYPEGSGGRLACLRLDDGAVFYSEED